ncbi:unnamed protein product [Symbiodinium sp. KB8]|nr:unnamed protein product [Symbiodinium sp. KB8]
MLQNQLQLDVFCYVPVISACQKGSAWLQALGIFDSMSWQRVLPDMICHSAAVGAARMGANWELAVSLVWNACQAELVPNRIMAGAAMRACQENGQWSSALDLLFRLCQVDLLPDLICFNIAISACEPEGHWRLSLVLLEELKRDALQASTVSYNAAISSCEKSSQWGVAIQLLEEMSSKSLSDRISYNAAISSCKLQWKHALALLTSISSEQMDPDEISFNAAISACEKCGAWDVALAILGLIATSGPAGPGIITLNAAMSACEKSHRWTEVLELFSQIQLWHLSPTEISWQVVLGACERATQWQAALQVLDHMISDQIVPSGTAAGSILHSLRQTSAAALETVLSRLKSVWLETGDVPEFPRSLQEEFSVVASAPGVFAVAKPEGVSTEQLVEQLAVSLKEHDFCLSVVSRLDQPTSGVLPLVLGAETSPSGRWCKAQFAGRLVSKHYICLCEGRSLGDVGSKGNISVPLRSVQVDADTWISEVCGQEVAGRDSFTSYEVIGDTKFECILPAWGVRWVELPQELKELLESLGPGENSTACPAILEAREFAKNIPKPKLAPKQVVVTATKMEEEEEVVQEALGGFCISLVLQLVQSWEPNVVPPSDRVTVRSAAGDVLVELKVHDLEPAARSSRLWQEVENHLPLGQSVSGLRFKGELLSSTIRLCDLDLPAVVVARTKVQRPQRYVTLWNGRTPFLVELLCRCKTRRVAVFPHWEKERQDWLEGEGTTDPPKWKRRRLESESEEERDLSGGYGARLRDFGSPVLDMEVEDVFIGRSELEDLTRRSLGFGPHLDGNAILLKRCDREYIFIGKDLFGFTAMSEIVKFASPVGLSSVPYTFAVDEHGRHYLFLEKVILDSVPESDKERLGPSQPYCHLYEDIVYDKCKFQLRYGRFAITYNLPSRMPHQQNPKYQKIVNGKVELISRDRFEKLLKKWFKAHGISHIQCWKVRPNGDFGELVTASS